MLEKNIKLEKLYFPESKTIIGYNDKFPTEIAKQNITTSIFPFHGKTHKIGCTNAVISTLKEAYTYNPSCVIFSHDDVLINMNYDHVVRENIKKIENGYDVVIRKPNDCFEDTYYLMDVFYLSKNAIEKIFLNYNVFLNENDIPRTNDGNSVSPEVWLFKMLNSVDLNKNVIDYSHVTNKDGEVMNDNSKVIEQYNQLLGEQMGYVHIKYGERGWK